MEENNLAIVEMFGANRHGEPYEYTDVPTTDVTKEEIDLGEVPDEKNEVNSDPCKDWNLCEGGEQPVPPTPVFAVVISDTENGSITANKDTAEEGETITLTATPDEGYELSDVTVTFEGEEVELTKVDENVYEFTMPAGDVTVSGEFANALFVDLGLPSGLLWAKTNLGAETETDFGNYYAWGEIETKNYYDWVDEENPNNNYKYANGSADKLTKYCPTDMPNYWDGEGSPDNKLTLELTDDVANQTNNSLRIPTKVEFEELLAETNNEWIMDWNGTGINGWRFMSQTDESKWIFLPCNGSYTYEQQVDNYCGEYWSSDVCHDSIAWEYPNNAWQLYIYENSYGEMEAKLANYTERPIGLGIRPVKVVS